MKIDAWIEKFKHEAIPFIKRMPLILKILRFKKHIDVICYSPDEFSSIRDKSSLVMDALENGEFIYTS
jgi:hypothetical protein